MRARAISRVSRATSQVLARDLDLSGGGFEVEIGFADLGFDLAAGVVQLGLALRQHGFGLGDVAGGSAALPERNAEGADGGEGPMRLGRVGADYLVVAADCNRRQAFGARRREGPGGGLDLGLGGFEIGSLVFRLGDGFIHTADRRGAEGKAVSELDNRGWAGGRSGGQG